MSKARLAIILVLMAITCAIAAAQTVELRRIKYNNPKLKNVDLGVGLWAWPLPMDYDKDGDYDMVVSCNDDPTRGTFFFENTAGNIKMPVFKPPVRIGRHWSDIHASYVDGEVHLLLQRKEIVDFYDKSTNFEKTVNIYHKKFGNHWIYADYDSDGDLDIIVGDGDRSDCKWDDSFDKTGNWISGRIHGYLYLIKNNGTKEKCDYAEPVKIRAADRPIDVYGMPVPCFADFDADGDKDLIVGSFVGDLTYFENLGVGTEPIFAEGRCLRYKGRDIHMELCMIVPVALDWDKDGDTDLIVGEEDGRVSLLENIGQVQDSLPVFIPQKFFQQEPHDIKFGALVTPYSFDFDSDGDEDLICGNTTGNIGFIENLGGGSSPIWDRAKYLKSDGKKIHIQAGYNGSIQGPCERKWGYTTLSVGDWDHDGLADIIVNSIWGKVLWYRNIGTKHKPKLAAAKAVQVQWEGGKRQKPAWNWWEPKGNNLITQWRTIPYIIDLNKDGLNDLVMLDYEGYLAFLERKNQDGKLVLLGPQRIFRDKDNQALQLNPKRAGRSGRRKFCLVDWDLDGKIDLLVNSKNIDFYKNTATKKGQFRFENQGPISELVLAGHSTCPTIVDWDKDGIGDLLVGAEDGYFYYMKNPNKK